MSKNFSHLDHNNQPIMIDVSDKDITIREATAECTVILPDVVKAALDDGEIWSAKGPVVQTAIIAGVMAAKKTSELIPFCHPITLESCKINIYSTEENNLTVRCICRLHAKTGVEMEALTGASIAGLTVYDMCKALSHDIQITNTRLIQKTGGKSDITTNSRAKP